MARQKIEIHQPLAGLDRAWAYQSQQPFTLSDAMNVRCHDVFEQRARLGSRPGLVKAYGQQVNQPTVVTSYTMDFYPTKDLELEGHSSTANSNWDGSYFHVGNDSAGLLDPLRTLLHFNLNAISGAATITSATLTLYCVTSTGSALAAHVYRVTRTTWLETLCTWNKYDGSVAWTTPGGDFTLTDGIDWTLGATGYQTIGGLQTLVTTAMGLAGGDAKQLHLILKAHTEDIGVNLNQYRSKDYPDGGNTYWPKLTVIYAI